ncbi:MAG: peptide deformylase [Patescibacteria group bacterium]
MKMTIIQKDNPTLHLIAREVSAEELGTPKIQKIIENMKEALHAEEDGVAIAAPQIDISFRIFVVSGKVPKLIEMQEKKETDIDLKDIKENIPDEIFINPKIVKASKTRAVMEEGCLSVRWLYGKVKRSKQVTIEAMNEKGEPIKRGASGLMAQIFQHEIDHLDGILFIDKATDIEEYEPNKKSN